MKHMNAPFLGAVRICVCRCAVRFLGSLPPKGSMWPNRKREKGNVTVSEEMDEDKYLTQRQNRSSSVVLTMKEQDGYAKGDFESRGGRIQRVPCF